MSKLFFSNPKVSLSFPTTNLSYCYIKYSGNTVATSKVVNSGKITTGSYISGDLSINTLYTFTLTPLGAGDVSGIVKTISVDTTPQVAGTKSNVKSTYEATRLQWSGTTYDNYTVTRSINNTNSYADISTNVKTNYYYDNDLSGNTFYYYYVKPYDAAGNQYQNATTLTIYTNVRAPTDMSYTFFDSSAVSVKFVTKNSFSSSYYNAAYAVSPTGAVLSISGDIQSGTITGLSKNTTYTCYAQTYLLANSGTTVTATTASPYVGGNIFLYSVSMNSISVGWSGQYLDRVAVSRRVGTLLPYVDICGADYASPYVDSDISGNTTYYYYVTPKVSVFTGSASTVVSATTPVAYPTDVSAIFYDTSAIKLQFSTPKNSYTSVVYSAIANHSTLGYTSTVTGTSPIMITNLSSGTTYTCYIQVNLNGGTIGTSSGLSVTTNSAMPSGYAMLLYVNSTTVPTKDATGVYNITGASVTSSYSQGSRTYNLSNTATTINSFTFTTNSYSICCWVYETTALNNGFWFQSSNSTGALLWNVSYINSMAFSASYNGSGTMNFNSYLSFNNVWAHWVITFDGSTAIFYRNGINKTSGSMTGSTETSKNWIINQGCTTYFNYLMFYNRVLTSNEVYTIYTLQY